MRRALQYNELTGQQKKIYDILRLFALYCATGLLVFYGEADLPNSEQLYEMKQEDYIQRYKAKHNGATPESIATRGGQGLAYAERVIEGADSVTQLIKQAGGISTFKAAFDELVQTQPRNMKILRDLSRRSATLETIAAIAEKNVMSERNIPKIREKLLIALAINISGRKKT